MISEVINNIVDFDVVAVVEVLILGVVAAFVAEPYLLLPLEHLERSSKKKQRVQNHLLKRHSQEK